MLLEIFLLIFSAASKCPKYELSSNPTQFITPINLLELFRSSQYSKYEWPMELTIPCVAELTTLTGKYWYSSIPSTYTAENMSVVIDLTSLSANYQIRQRPVCSMTTANNLCMIGTTYPLYMPRVSFLHQKGAVFDACDGQAFAIKMFDYTPEAERFVGFTFSHQLCVSSGAFIYYDTLVVNRVTHDSFINCIIGPESISHSFKIVGSSPNCVGSPRRILFPRNNTEMYNGDSVATAKVIRDICFPTSGTVLRDSTGTVLFKVPTVAGKNRYSCEFTDDSSSKIYFDIIIPVPPKITKPLKDCKSCDNTCTFSFDYDPGLNVSPVDVLWYFNGEELQNTFLSTISADKKTVTMNLTPDTAGNVQAILDSRYGTQMSTAFTEYTKPPVFAVDFPEYYINSSHKVFTATVDFSGADAIKMWFKADGKPLESTNPNAKTSVDLVNRKFSIEIDNTQNSPPIGSFSAVFEAGSCLVESTVCTISTTDKIRSTVSLMIPVLGVLGAAVLLAIILIPICVVYRNRHSNAYRLAMVERQCGLNPDKDFKTLNDFGESSRRNARNQPPFSILPSAPGSNEGSWAPLNNLPDIKEQASFVNEY